MKHFSHALLLPLLALSVSAGFGQSITASANSCTSGFTGCTFTAVATSAPTIARVVYSVDAYPAIGWDLYGGATTNQTIAATTSVGHVLSAPWTLHWNTFNVMNGPHQLVATGYDALGAVVATSSAVNFTVANTWPSSCAPAMTVATGTALGSPWSTFVTVTPTITSCTGDNMTYRWWVDGILQFSTTSTSNSASFPVDTSQFLDGPHVVALSIKDTTTNTVYSGHPNNDALEWSRTVTFSNTTTPAELRVNARESFVSIGGTVALACTLVNADGSTSSPTCDYYSQNPTVCTVNATTGLVTAVANGPCQVRVMAELISGNDLVLNGCSGDCLSSVAHPFSQSSVGDVVHITGGTGFTTGFYEGKTWFAGSNILNLTAVAGTVGSTSGQFKTGPSRTAWVFVWPDNIMPHFSVVDGSILTSYNPAKSGYHNSMFSSSLGLTDQTYQPASFLGDICISGYNAIELGIVYNKSQSISGTSFSSFKSQQDSFVSANEARIPQCPGSSKQVFYHGDGGQMVGGSADLYATTRGALISGTYAAVPFAQYVFGSWAKMFWVTMADEVNAAFGFRPLQGPMQFSQPNSGLTQIVATAGACAVTCTSCSFNQNNNFVISGATTSGLNSAGGAVFHATGVTTSAFNFSCPGVANGTYNSGNNPSLTIEPLAALWFASNTDYVHSDAFKLVRGWDLANASPMKMTYANAAQTNPLSVACWEGNTAGCSQSYGGTTTTADFADMYFTHSAFELYLGSRASTYTIVNTVAEGANNNQMRQAYGIGFSPDLPILAISQNSPNQYGYQGFSIGVTSMSGGVMTFASDISAQLPVVYSGISRLTWNGNNYYFLDYDPVTNSAHMLLAKTNFTGTSSTGTVHFANGNTESITSATASGTTNPCSGSTICGDVFSVASDVNLGTNRGQAFTVTGATGTGATGMNANTFVHIPESRAASTTLMYVREVPGASFNCASGCAAATVIADNYFVKGRQGYQSSDLSGTAIYHAGFCFSYVIEDIIVRAAGQRLYKGGISMQGTGPTGFTGNWTFNSVFDTTTTGVQLFGNPHFENGNGTPCFHAASHASMWGQARSKYLLQPALSSPDYGSLFEAAARGGANGNILLVANMTDGPQTRTLDFTNYPQSGQGFFCDYLLPDGTWTITQFASGTTSNAFTFAPNGVVGCSFPTVFAGTLSQPSVSSRLADVTGADKIVVRYAYDPYWLDTALANVVDCSTGPCALPVDKNIGTIWTRTQYLKSGAVISTGDAQQIQ